MSATTELSALAVAPAEAAPNAARDAAPGVRKGPDLDAALQGVDAKAAKAMRKRVAALKRAVALSDAERGAEALALCAKTLDAEPECPLANHVTAVTLDRMGRYSAAIGFYERAWKRDPHNPEIYSNLAMTAWRLDMLPAAEKFFRLYCQMQPGDPNGAVNLGCVLRDQSRFSDAIEVIRAAIYAHPENAALWNALGTVLNDTGDPAQAVTFYQEALRIDPDFARARNNIAVALELTGETEAALANFDAALALFRLRGAPARDVATIRHSRALTLLALGRVEEGWCEYASRLDPAYPQATLFAIKKPCWDGANPAQLKDKRVLLIGEQGLGDEVMFLNAAPDLIEAIGPDGKLMIACEARLVPLIARSFPEAEAGPHLTMIAEGRHVRVPAPALKGAAEVDIWAPMANALRAFRGSVEAFPDRAGYLRAESDEMARWRKWLASLGPGPKVGLLWKSLKMDAKRSKFFSSFEAWKPVLQTRGVQFVNLQYGEVNEELEQAEKQFGVRIHQPEGIDLKNDLDRLAALGAALDLTIGPMNAASNLAAACGGEIWILNAQKHAWTTFGTGALPFYPRAQVFAAARFGGWTELLDRIADALAERAAKTKAA